MREMTYCRMLCGQILNTYGINLNPCVMVLARESACWCLRVSLARQLLILLSPTVEAKEKYKITHNRNNTDATRRGTH